MEQDKRNETPNTSRPHRKRDANKIRTSLLPHVEHNTRSTTSKKLILLRILGNHKILSQTLSERKKLV